MLDSILLVDESCDSLSDEEINSSPLFKLGRSPVSAVDDTPIIVEDVREPNPIPVDVGLDSDTEDAAVDNGALRDGVVVEVELDSGLVEDVVSVLPLAVADVRVFAFDAAVEVAAEGVVTEDNDAGVADVVSVEVLVELACAVVVVTGGDVFVFVVVVGATTTYDVPNPNKCPQYLLSSMSSSKNISFIRKNVWPVSKASEPA